MMSRPLDHAEYIRLKYLGGGSGDSKDQNEGKKKKKRKAAKGVAQNMKIIDDDIDLNNIKVKEEDELAYAPKEEKPSIAGVIDERPNHLKRKDLDTNKWRTIEPVDSIVKQEPESPPRPESHSRRKETTKKMSPDSDASPPRAPRVRHDSDSDLSPVRKSKRHDSDSDLSPERKSKRHDSDSDLSPPRPSNARHHHDNQERTSQRKRRNSRNRDLSPPRRRDRTSKDNESHSPLRRHHRDSRPDSSRKERRRHDSDSDLSPPRSSQRSSHRSYRRSRSPSDDRSRKKETLAGKVAGLSDARSVREEVKKLKEKERELMQRTGDDDLGRNAKTVYRDRGTGHVRDMDAEAAVKIKPDKDEEERQAKYKDWSKGLKQREEQKIRAQEDMREMDKPLARYEDDEDRDKYLKDRELEEDPMLQFIRKKKQKEEVKAATSRGEVVLIKPKYSGPPAPPNRFQIQPGYRWDGVDRSNGFEKKLLDKGAEKMAIQEEAYRWGTEDM